MAWEGGKWLSTSIALHKLILTRFLKGKHGHSFAPIMREEVVSNLLDHKLITKN